MKNMTAPGGSFYGSSNSALPEALHPDCFCVLILGQCLRVNTFLKRQRRGNPTARFAGPGIQNKRDLRPVRTRPPWNDLETSDPFNARCHPQFPPISPCFPQELGFRGLDRIPRPNTKRIRSPAGPFICSPGLFNQGCFCRLRGNSCFFVMRLRSF